jgi:hypothetical protein
MASSEPKARWGYYPRVAQDRRTNSNGPLISTYCIFSVQPLATGALANNGNGVLIMSNLTVTWRRVKVEVVTVTYKDEKNMARAVATREKSGWEQVQLIPDLSNAELQMHLLQ